MSEYGVEAFSNNTGVDAYNAYEKGKRFIVRYWQVVVIIIFLALIGAIAVTALGVGSAALTKATQTNTMVVANLNNYCLQKTDRNQTIVLSGSIELTQKGLKYDVMVMGITVSALHIMGPLELEEDTTVPLAVCLCGYPGSYSCAQTDGRIQGIVTILGTQRSPFLTINQFETALKLNPTSFFVAVKQAMGTGGEHKVYGIYSSIHKCDSMIS